MPILQSAFNRTAALCEREFGDPQLLLLKTNLKELRLPTMNAEFAKLAREAASANEGYERYLLRLTEQEVAARHANAQQARIHHAGFPALKDFDTYDFSILPTLSKQKMLELTNCQWIDEHFNACLIGEPCTGKTHCAIALGLSPQLADKISFADIDQQHDPRRTSDHFPLIVGLNMGTSPQPAAGGFSPRIVSLTPNPVGDESENEAATIGNRGSQAGMLQGWTLRDSKGKTWKLDDLANLGAGEQKSIKRSKQAMSMNNRGDTIELVDPAGQVVQSVTYGQIREDELVEP